MHAANTLSIHPTTGLTAIGMSRRGPIWPVMGGADAADTDSESDSPADPTDDPDGADGKEPTDAGEKSPEPEPKARDADADGLGEAGKKAIDAMKAERNAARRDLRTARRDLDTWSKLADEHGFKTVEDLRAFIDEKTGKKDDVPDPEKIREQARNEARAEAHKETLRDRVLDKIETKAAKLFADPEDARALLGSSVDDFIDPDGSIDVEGITDALGDLLKKKPHLAAATARRFPASADGGARKSSKPDQLGKQDLKRMKPEEILKAQEEGRLNDLLGVT